MKKKTKPLRFSSKEPSGFDDAWHDLRGIGVVRERGVRRVNLSKLARENPAQWNGKWKALKRQRPELARLLKEPLFDELRVAFDADVLIEEQP